MGKSKKQHSLEDVICVGDYLVTEILPVLFPTSYAANDIVPGVEIEVMQDYPDNPDADAEIAVPSSGGAELYLGRDFFKKDPSQQLDTLVHECLHLLFRTHNDMLESWGTGILDAPHQEQLDAVVCAAEHSVIRAMIPIVVAQVKRVGVLPGFERGGK